jgi:hypothetical protein
MLFHIYRTLYITFLTAYLYFLLKSMYTFYSSALATSLHLGRQVPKTVNRRIKAAVSHENQFYMYTLVPTALC